MFGAAPAFAEPWGNLEMCAIAFSCPRCGHIHEDPFEVLPADTLGTILCEGCRQEFAFALMECHRCANEHAFAWPSAPPLEALNLLQCDGCGSTFRLGDSDAPQEHVT